MEKEITLNDLTALLDFGERTERELNRLFCTPATPATTTPTTKPRPTHRPLLCSSYQGHKLAKN